MVLVPADRARLGVAVGMSVRENISLPWIDRISGRFGIDKRREQQDVMSLLERFDVRPADPAALMGTLSGGNQQKTVLARWIAQNPKVLVLHEPTQGVDVGARQQIFKVIRDAVVAGMSVIYASLEYEDLAHMCDKVLVFRDGSVAAELVGSDITADRIVDISMRKAST
jgi:ribose transport system ATP-binding protein